MKSFCLISNDKEVIPVFKHHLEKEGQYKFHHFEKIIEFIKSINDDSGDEVYLVLDMESIDLSVYSGVLSRIKNDVGFPIIYLYDKSYKRVYKDLDGKSLSETYLSKEFGESELFACLREATLKSHYERQIRSLNQRLERQDNYLRVGLFASSFIHEMNNLYSYLGFSFRKLKKVLNSYESAEQLEQGVLDSLETSTEALSMLMEKTTRYRNLQKGKTGAESKKDIHLGSFVESVIKIFDHNFAKNDFKLIQLGEKDITVNVDEVTLLQTLINLISNAYDELGALPQEDRWVKVKLYDDDYYAYIDVVDGGKGVPENVIPYIFQTSFSTKDNSSSEEIGAGVGLGICLQRVRENIKGDLSIIPSESNTTFRLTIPKMDPDELKLKVKSEEDETVGDENSSC